MQESLKYQPEYNLLQDAYLGTKDILRNKLNYLAKNNNTNKKEGQDWFLYGFKQRSDAEMRAFRKYPDIADYFTTPADFIYDKAMELSIDYDHIIDDNYDRFVSVGLTDKWFVRKRSKENCRKSKA